jgi:hypothetical protein
MTFFRRRLPRWAAAWLVFQVASLAPLVAKDCCVTHKAISTGEHGCRKSAPAPHCPMRAADGSACPMHRAGGNDSAPPDASCSLRGTCSEPMVALAALLSNQGVLTDPIPFSIDHGVSIVHPRMHEPIVSRPDAPDPPPPRA